MKKLLTLLTALGVATTLALAGCGTQQTKTTGGKGGKQLAVTGPAATSLDPGETEEIKVTVKRTGFDGDVAVEFSNLPEGVSIDGGSKHTIATGVNEKTFKITAAAGAKPDERTAKVTATAAGVDPNPVDFKVNVTGAGQKGGDKTAWEKRREELRQTWKAASANLDKSIKDLREWSKTASADARKRADATLKDLEKRKEQLDKQAAELGEQTADSWENFSSRFQTSMRELQRGVSNAVEEFKKDSKEKKDNP